MKKTKATKAPAALRVVTFNVKYGKKTDHLAAAFLTNSRLKSADVIVLQEIEDHKREKISRAERLASKMSMQWVYVPARMIRGANTHGLAVLSRYPLSNLKIIPLQYYRLFLRSRNRIAMAVTVDWNGVAVRLYNVHLDTTLNAEERIRQLDAVMKDMDDDKDSKFILAGDFNVMPFKWLRRGIPIAFANQRRKIFEYLVEQGFQALPRKVGYTLKRGIFRFSLDSVFIRGGSILTAEVERGVTGSDHKPLWVDCSFG